MYPNIVVRQRVKRGKVAILFTSISESIARKVLSESLSESGCQKYDCRVILIGSISIDNSAHIDILCLYS